MEDQPHIDIMIVNYSNWQDTLECLESLKKIDYENLGVVIVDVANIQGSFDHISKWVNQNNGRQYILLRLKDNKGYAAANNLGLEYILKQIDCEYIWLLNNDTEIEKDSLIRLLRYYEKRKIAGKNIGFVGSKIMDFYDRNIIQSAGGSFCSWTGYVKMLGMGQKDIGQYDKLNRNVDFVIGASMFFHKSLIDRIGLMNEGYFIYFEDIDWCVSARKKGFVNTVCTASVVYHKQGGSTGNIYLKNRYNPETAKYLYINYIKIYRKYYKIQLPIAYFILLKQSAGKLYHRKYSEAQMILKIFFRMLLGLP